MYQFLKEQFIATGCRVSIINGMPDHVHCLFLLSKQQSIAEVIKQEKGSSAHFINQQQILPVRFSWQNGYAAYSVSEKAVTKVFEYIKNQKQHHITKDFEAEYQYKKT
jgi:REP element-mobilizing transposase RayT